MGNVLTGQYCPSDQLKALVSKQVPFEEMCRGPRVCAVDIDMSQENLMDGWKQRNTIMFNDSTSAENYFILIFPCHPDENKRVLYTYNYNTIIKLNRELNKRLQESYGINYVYETVRMAVLCGNVVYKLHNLNGTAYLVWATYVNSNHNNIVNRIVNDVPILVQMDGYNVFQSVLQLVPIIKPDTVVQPLNVARCKFFVPFNVFLWTNEADPRDQHATRVEIASREQAVDECSDEICEDLLPTNLQEEPEPFSQDNMVDLDSSEPYSLKLFSGTPRVSVDKFVLDQEEGFDETP